MSRAAAEITPTDNLRKANLRCDLLWAWERYKAKREGHRRERIGWAIKACKTKTNRCAKLLSKDLLTLTKYLLSMRRRALETLSLIAFCLFQARVERVQNLIASPCLRLRLGSERHFTDIFIPLHYLHHKFYVYSCRAIKTVSPVSLFQDIAARPSPHNQSDRINRFSHNDMRTSLLWAYSVRS